MPGNWLRLGKLDEHDLRMFLHSFQNHFAAIRGNVEVADVEVGRKIRQLPLRAGFGVNRMKRA